MSKIRKILTLINLLHYRRVVPLRTILDSCDITERTAYRYLNDISEANVPVYFDSGLGGYTLSNKDGHPISDLSVDDAILILFALKLMASFVNGSYQTALNNLISRLAVRQSWPIEAIDLQTEKCIASDEEKLDHSSALNWAMLQAAKWRGSGIRLVQQSNSNDRSVIQIDKPTLAFRGEWMVESQNMQRDIAIPLDSISRVVLERSRAEENI